MQLFDDVVPNWVTEIPEEPVLTQREKELRDWFVNEYLVDFDYVQAAVRLGFGSVSAFEYAKRFQFDPYVQRAISKAMNSEPDDPESYQTVHRRRILNKLEKEASYNGPGSSHGARVSALSKLVSIHGMEAPTKTVSKVTHDGKVLHDANVNVNHNFNFESLDEEDRLAIRKLLEKQIANNAERTKS